MLLVTRLAVKTRANHGAALASIKRSASCSLVRHRSSASMSHSEEEVERKFVVTAAVVDSIERLKNAAPEVAQMRDIYFDNTDHKLSVNDMWLRRRNKGFELKWPQARESAVGGDEGIAGIDFYNETTSWSQIADQLQHVANIQLTGARPLEGEKGEPAFAWLQQNGLSPFAAIDTTRLRYKLLLPRGGSTQLVSAGADISSCHAVNVDLDEVRYDLSVGVEDGIIGAAAGTGPDGAPAAAGAVLAGEGAAAARTVPSATYSLGEVELVRAGGGMPAGQAMADVFASLGISHEPVRGKVLEWLVRFRPRHYAALERCGLIAAKMQ